MTKISRNERVIKCEYLKETIRIAKKKGYKVYTFDSFTREIKQVFFVDLKNRIGTASTGRNNYRFGTIHKPTKGCGTGFGVTGEHYGYDNPEDIDMCFVKPKWASKYIVQYYKDWNEYIEKAFLKYFEI